MLQAVWRFRWSSLLIVGGMIVLALAWSVYASPGVTAQATIGLSQSRTVLGTTPVSEAAMARHAAQRARFMRSDEVLLRAAEILSQQGQRTTTTELRRSITSSYDDSDVITIQATAPTSKLAVEQANAVVDAYGEVSAKQARDAQARVVAAGEAARERLLELAVGRRASPNRLAATEALARLEIGVNDAIIDSRVVENGVAFVNRATFSATTPASSPVRMIAAAALIGLLLAIVISYLRLDRPGQLIDASLRVGRFNGNGNGNGHRPVSEPQALASDTSGAAAQDMPKPKKVKTAGPRARYANWSVGPEGL